MTANPSNHRIPTPPNKERSGSNPGSGIDGLPANAEIRAGDGRQAGVNLAELERADDAPERVKVEDMLAGALDLAKVGHVLLQLPLVALQLGHLSLKDTAVYLHPGNLEGRYALDFMALLLLRRMWERDEPA